MMFTKIRCTKDGVELQSKIQLDGGAGEARTFTCSEPPLPELPASLQAFKSFILSLVPLRDQDKLDEENRPCGRVLDDLTVTSIHLDEESKTKRLGLIVTAVLPIEDANNRPLVINTPRLREWEGDGTPQPKGTFGDDIARMIDAAQDAARDYYSGKRGQAEMFDAEQTTAAPEEKTNGTDPAAPPKVRRRRPRPIIPEVGEAVNADATQPPTDEFIAKQLGISGWIVPTERIAKWLSSERDEALRWAQDPEGNAAPYCVRRDGEVAELAGSAGD